MGYYIDVLEEKLKGYKEDKFYMDKPCLLSTIVDAYNVDGYYCIERGCGTCKLRENGLPLCPLDRGMRFK